MRNIGISLGALGLMSLGVACSGGGGKRTATPAESTFTASTDIAGTLTASGTVSALNTLVAEVTVLPNGTVVTSRGDIITAELATQAAAAATAGPGEGTGDPVRRPTAAEGPPCVIHPEVAGCATPPPESTAIAPDAKGMAIDSNVSTPDADVTPVSAAVGQSFVVGVNIVTVPQPYQGYEWDLVIDGPITFVSSVPDKPVGLTLCSEATQVGSGNEYYGGCLSTNKNLTFTGRLDTVTLQCARAGAGQMRLRKQGEPGSSFGTDLLNSDAEPITGDVGSPVPVTCT